jgi:3-hydroxyacyl-CoA dehydrogenase
MGHAIGQLFALKGFSVSLYDANHQVLEEVPARIRRNFQAFLDMGLVTSDDVERSLSRIRLCKGMEEAVTQAGLVIEAVKENLALKQRLLAELERYVRPDTVLSSNTSAISITLIAEPLEKNGSSEHTSGIRRILCRA